MNRLFVCLLLMCLWNSGMCQDPEIAKDILPEIKRVGQTGVLNCTVTRQGNTNTVYWIYAATGLEISADDSIRVNERFNTIIDGYRKYEIKRIREKEEQFTYQLIIHRLQRDDAGTYRCQIVRMGQSDGKNMARKDGRMIVLMPPVIALRSTSQTLKVKEGGDINMTCAASGFPEPKILWVRGNGMNLPRPINAFAYEGGLLQLKSIRAQDRGVYRCLADNNVKPPATNDATLYVEFSPHAKAIQSTYGQAQNRLFDVTIECVVTAFPEPDLFWYQQTEKGWSIRQNDEKHKVHVIRNHGASLSVDAFWMQLVIINVQANDYGVYKCEGANSRGSSYDVVEVYETSECQGPNCPPEYTATASLLNPVFVIITLTSLYSFSLT